MRRYDYLPDLKREPLYSDEINRTPAYTAWPKAPTHADLDPLLRAAERAEAERKAAAARVNRKLGRIMRRKG